jgi:hypothetical protein
MVKPSEQARFLSHSPNGDHNITANVTNFIEKLVKKINLALDRSIGQVLYIFVRTN